MKKAFTVVAMLAGLAAAAGNGFAQNAGQPLLEQGITHAVADGTELKLDLARPSTGEGPFPAIVYFDGNCWGYCGGTRGTYDWEIGIAAQHGYVAATVDVRKLQTVGREYKNTFPTQVYDAKAAVRWLRANAAKYNIDSNHIGATGWSSGGHLALMLGLTDASDGLEGNGPNMEFSSRVQAVVSSCAPSDLSNGYELNREIVTAFIGASPTQAPEKYKAASPIFWVTADDPPVLIISGDKDGFGQSVLLDAKLQEAGVVHSLIVKKGKGHCDFIFGADYLNWFDKYLKGR